MLRIDSAVSIIAANDEPAGWDRNVPVHGCGRIDARVGSVSCGNSHGTEAARRDCGPAKSKRTTVHSFSSVAKVIASLQSSAVRMMRSQPRSKFSVRCAHKRGRLTCRYVSAWQFTLVKLALIIVGRTLIAPHVFAQLPTASRF